MGICSSTIPETSIPVIQDNFKKPLSINDFTKLERLGHGAHGSVLKVKYKYNKKIYAIKEISQNRFKSKGKEIKEIDYLREKEILYDLSKKNNPHIVKLYADFQDSNYRYLVMEYCEGTILQNLRGKDLGGYVDQNLVINILTQLLETLSFLHDNCHIMHRDIKPDNIIIDKNNNIKLLDFGLAAYMTHPNKKLVSNKSLKGARPFLPPEILLYAQPLHYDYKVDVFSLGFTMYSLMNPPKNGKPNLPEETEGEYGNIKRYDKYLVNNFYSTWLIEFVFLLFEKDQEKRPSSKLALTLLKGLQTNPEYAKAYYNIKMKSVVIHDINVIFKRNESNPINNNNIQNNTQNIDINASNIKSITQMQEVDDFLQPNMGKNNRIISSMKCMLYILYKLDKMEFIKAQINSIFDNCEFDYKKLILYSYYKMLDSINELKIGKISQVGYDQLINKFIQLIINNSNCGITGTRPIILFYMMTSIFKDEFKKNFDDIYQNEIYDDIIQNNFIDFKNLMSIEDPRIYESISQKIYFFKNNYKGPFVDNFYFIMSYVSKCPQCSITFGFGEFSISQFLQLDVPNYESNLSDIINDYFTPKIGNGNYNCQNCGSKGKKLKQNFCLNLPNYLLLEFEDKNKINFNEEIMVPLYNGQNFYYQYFASIYKYDNNDISGFCAVFKIGNTYYFYSNDKVKKVPKNYTFLECPSMAIYKKISLM